MTERVVDAGAMREDETQDRAIRPKRLAEYIGQPAVKAQLGLFIEAAKPRAPKRWTMCWCSARRAWARPRWRRSSPPSWVWACAIRRVRCWNGPGDLAALLTNLQPRDVLFIDEIHRLSPVVEEVLYPAMEDYQLDIMIGDGPAARSIKLNLPPFTLVGATTRAGLLTSPLRDRFGIVQRLDFYSDGELAQIVARSAGILGVDRHRQRARRGSRSVRAVRRASPTGCCGGCATLPRCAAMARIDAAIADAALDLLDVDPQGHGCTGPAAAGHHYRQVRWRPRGHRESGGRHR